MDVLQFEHGFAAVGDHVACGGLGVVRVAGGGEELLHEFERGEAVGIEGPGLRSGLVGAGDIVARE